MSDTGDDPVTLCLQRVGEPRLGMRTLLIRGSAQTARPPADVWDAWTDLARWPSWSPLHVNTTWTSEGGFRPGATFEQRIALGFPIGTITAQVEVDLLRPARLASWKGNDNGIRSCHVWDFAPLPDGGTRITNVELFAGATIPLIKSLVARRWNKRFQQAVDGLVALLEEPARTI